MTEPIIAPRGDPRTDKVAAALAAHHRVEWESLPEPWGEILAPDGTTASRPIYRRRAAEFLAMLGATPGPAS